MYGWRARIGIIIPSTNYVMEPEINNYLPEGVSAHFSRLKVGDKFSSNSLTEMAKNTEITASSLSSVADIIVYACTSGSFIGGEGWDDKLIKRMNKSTGKPSTTTSTAVLLAFKKMQIKKISIATPYTEEVNIKLKEFFLSNGLDVINIKGLGVDKHGGQGIYHPSDAFRLAKSIAASDSDAVFISCTNFRTFEIIDILEKDLGKLVITSNQATLWYALRKAGIEEKILGLGQLMTI